MSTFRIRSTRGAARQPRHAAQRGAVLTAAAAAVLLGLPLPAVAQSVQAAAARPEVHEALERAERAYADGDFIAADTAYASVVAADPQHSRALFRLAHLRRRTPREAAALLERYVGLVPRDPWGHLALASAYADAGQRRDALDAYEEALALEPKDRDIALGGPRLFARLGRTDRAIDAYRLWLAEHPDDGEAWRELADQMQRARRYGGAKRAAERALLLGPADTRLAARVDALRMRTAPAVEVGVLAIGETDLGTFGGSVGGDTRLGDAGRIGVALVQRRISGLGEVAASRRLLLRTTFSPRADLEVQAAGGIVQTSASGSNAFDRTRPEALARVRRRPNGSGLILDLRAQHGPVDVTPQLALDEITRSQITSAADAPLASRLRLRGVARLAAMTRPDERNLGTRYGGGLAIVMAEAMHLSGQVHHARYRQAAAGYFAPRLAETMELGFDVDREWGALNVALDAGGGLQRVQQHDQAAGSWGPAVRAWALVSWALRPGRSLVFEAETYDSQIADAVVAAETWRYASVTASLRIALR